MRRFNIFAFTLNLSPGKRLHFNVRFLLILNKFDENIVKIVSKTNEHECLSEDRLERECGDI